MAIHLRQCVALESYLIVFDNVLVPDAPIEYGCQSDSECPSQEACVNQECDNPCLLFNPCVVNAVCKVYNTLPLRTMTCVCEEGFTGKGNIQCSKIRELF